MFFINAFVNNLAGRPMGVKMKLLKTVLGEGIGLEIGLGVIFLCRIAQGSVWSVSRLVLATSAAPPSPPKKGRVVEQPIQPVVVKKVAPIKPAA